MINKYPNAINQLEMLKLDYLGYNYEILFETVRGKFKVRCDTWAEVEENCRDYGVENLVHICERQTEES
jgi:hypothetical protein